MNAVEEPEVTDTLETSDSEEPSEGVESSNSKMSGTSSDEGYSSDISSNSESGSDGKLDDSDSNSDSDSDLDVNSDGSEKEETERYSPYLCPQCTRVIVLYLHVVTIVFIAMRGFHHVASKTADSLFFSQNNLLWH